MRIGFWNQCDAALACGVSDAMWRYYMRVGHVPRPSHRYGLRYYYTRQEVEELKKTFLSDGEELLATGKNEM